VINAFNTRDTLFVRRAVVMAEILMECQMIESHFFEAVKRCELESFRIIERFVTFYDQHVRKRNAILILYIIIAPMYYIHGGTPPPATVAHRHGASALYSCCKSRQPRARQRDCQDFCGIAFFSFLSSYLSFPSPAVSKLLPDASPEKHIK
jgi:hypothetical protein